VGAEDFSEFDLIKNIRDGAKSFSDALRTGIGDDCAVISSSMKADLLVTTDLLMEGVHFDRRWFSLEQIGEKALRVNLSDIAAMGGIPEYAFLSLALSRSLSRGEIDALLEGVQKTAEAFEVTIAGGDISKANTGMALSVMILGRVEPARAILRKGARVGDRLFVSGTLGDASLGLRLMEEAESGPDAEFLKRRQWTPEPRLELGRVLLQNGWVSAMIDVSDGLSSDLRHLCEASGVGAVVRRSDVPCSEAYRRTCSAHALDEAMAILHGGEDYELLFTVPREIANSQAVKSLPVVVTCIGEILPSGSGIFLEYPDGRRDVLAPLGYDHFR
jgi:thiamine-monophosphate kinase